MDRLLAELSPELRARVLAHPSFAASHNESYERLEFVGDAILGAAISAELFTRFPDAAEGWLSKVRSSVVSRTSCAEVARRCGLGEIMIAAAPTAFDRPHVEALARNENVLAALVEGVIGGAFVELGYERTAEAIVEAFSAQIEWGLEHCDDPKTELQEFAQRSGSSVAYEMVSAEGPDHERIFHMRARMGDGNEAMGSGRTKKQAERQAAERLLAELRAPGSADA